jgi:hypothetical protein
MVIIHRPGRVHSNVDPLSRLPRIPAYISPARSDLPADGLSTEHEELQQTWVKFLKKRELELAVGVISIEAKLGRKRRKKTATTETDKPAKELASSKKEKKGLHVYIDDKAINQFVEGYKTDKDFSTLLERTTKEKGSDAKMRAYRRSSNGLLYFEDADHNLRLCVPRTERNAILKEVHDGAHESAHAGWERTLSSLRERFYWPEMRKDATEYVRTCDPCQKIKHDRGAGQGYLHPLEIPVNPFDTITLDLITGLPTSHAKDAVLVVVDKLTKFAHFIATTSEITASETAILLFRRIVKLFGLPQRIVGDRDPRWTSAVWKVLSQLLKTRLALSTSRHPQTDGQTEVMNQHLETMLRAYVQADQRDWASWLDILQFAYNNAVHSSHKETPAELLLGYKPRTPLDFLVESGLTASNNHIQKIYHIGRRNSQLTEKTQGPSCPQRSCERRHQEELRQAGLSIRQRTPSPQPQGRR